MKILSRFRSSRFVGITCFLFLWSVFLIAPGFAEEQGENSAASETMTEEGQKDLLTDSALDLSKKLGEVAIRMVSKGQPQLLVSDQGAQMSQPTEPSSPDTNLAAFEQLLKDGADPSFIRIAGFQPAGQNTFANGLTMMSTGNPGRVVLAKEGGLSLASYLKRNKLTAASDLLTAYGPFPPDDVEVFGNLLTSASEALRQGDSSKMLALMPEDIAEAMKQEFNAYAQLRQRIVRLEGEARTKNIQLIPGFESESARDIFEMVDNNSTVESDGTDVWVSTRQGYFKFKKAGEKWMPSMNMEAIPKVVAFLNNKARLADALFDGIEKGEITNDNVKDKTYELVDKFLSP